MATETMERADLLAVSPESRFSWGGVIIGAVTTLALGIVFLSLGAALGLSAINPAAGEWGGGAAIGSGIWALVSILVATFLGAMLAARASTLFFKRDAALQGLFTWALAFLASMFFVVGMASQASTVLIGSAVEATGSAAATGAAETTPAQREQLQQQAQELIPGAGTAQAAADVGQAMSWWFFLTAALGLLAGLLGGIAGMPKNLRMSKPLEVRRQAQQPLKPRESST